MKTLIIKLVVKISHKGFANCNSGANDVLSIVNAVLYINRGKLQPCLLCVGIRAQEGEAPGGEEANTDQKTGGGFAGPTKEGVRNTRQTH